MMRSHLVIPVVLGLASACTPNDAEPPGTDASWEAYDPFEHVDPFIGTGGVGGEVTGLNPGASMPTGMTLVGPDSRHSVTGAPGFYHFGGYHYDDDHIAGFSHTHSHGMGVNDYGGVHVMARADGWDDALTDPVGRMAPFSHDAEWAEPGWYAVELGDDGTRVDIVATTRGGHTRFTFPEGSAPVVLLDLGHVLGTVEIGDAEARVDLSAGTLEGFQLLQGGYSRRFGGLQTHIAARLDPTPVAAGAWDDPAAPVAGATAAAGPTSGVWLEFPEGTTQVDLRVGLSWVDLDGAWNNLDAELPDTDLDARRAEAAEAWRAELSRVHVWGGSDDQRTRYHTAQYHSLLMPSRADDVDGRYRGLDDAIHTTDHPYYSDLSLWDTFRTLHPWYILVHPERQVDVVRSLVRMGEDGGNLPRWPLAHGYTGGMIGSPQNLVLAETWLKGLRDGWDVDGAFDMAIAHATQPMANAGRSGVERYVELGFVPGDEVGRAASLTLEYAWADGAVAGWADAMGRDPGDLPALADSWREVWDPDTGFFRSRTASGEFDEDFDELLWAEDYVEGNAWHYVWTVPHDVQGMIEVQHGGDVEAFHARYDDYWDEVFAEPDDVAPDDYYWHGNEPVMHYAALGSMTDRPDLSADAMRFVLAERYPTAPRGLDGNDDSGTLSAWYLWVAAGMFPIAGTADVVLGSPIFSHIEIDRGDEGLLVIDAPGTSDAVRYPTAFAVDGEPVGPVIHHDRLGGSAHLEFTLSDAP